jgi:(p)ppGpp synthase/HD superfamily hydrolase
MIDAITRTLRGSIKVRQEDQDSKSSHDRGKVLSAGDCDMGNKDSGIFKAIKFAAKVHAGQFRKGRHLPYIIHPLGVAKILIDYECSEEIVSAGILHDTIEDTGTAAAHIRQVFGEHVANLVEGASEPNHETVPWENRKLHTLQFLKYAPMDVLLVSCADKLDDITAIREDHAKLGDALWARFNRPKDKQRWYYRSLADAFIVRVDGEPSAALFNQFKAAVDRVFI